MSNETAIETPKRRRERLGLTQFEMAIKADVSVSTIQAYEAGRLANPQPRIARKIAAAYSGETVPSPLNAANAAA